MTLMSVLVGYLGTTLSIGFWNPCYQLPGLFLLWSIPVTLTVSRLGWRRRRRTARDGPIRPPRVPR